jgi:hypothetical protein
MKLLLKMIAAAAFAVVAANADDISITFDNPYQTGLPGQELEFFGTIQNLDDIPVFMDSDDFNFELSAGSYTKTDAFGSTPYPLGDLESSGDLELFDYTLSDPVVDPPGTYTGTYTITGGVGGDGEQVLGQANFSVTIPAVPEPASFLLMGVGLAMFALVGRRFRTSTVR